jgi:hypothetical protein
MRTVRTAALFCVALCVVLTTALFAAEATIDSFTARSDGRAIMLDWRASRETEVARYEIERSTGVQGEFKKIGTVSALTTSSVQNAYRFVDDNAFQRSGNDPSTQTANALQSAGLYAYRLKIIGADEKATYTNPITVTHTVSSVRRTWGMIKEMFR